MEREEEGIRRDRKRREKEKRKEEEERQFGAPLLSALI